MRSRVPTLSIGSGPHGDAQYLFACESGRSYLRGWGHDNEATAYAEPRVFLADTKLLIERLAIHRFARVPNQHTRSALLSRQRHHPALSATTGETQVRARQEVRPGWQNILLPDLHA
jgi:hypothetical protein